MNQNIKYELSIIIPTCNRNDKLLACLKSLINQINTENLAINIEIIIVDDFNLISTKKIVENLREELNNQKLSSESGKPSFHFKLLYLKSSPEDPAQFPLGPAAARNVGIKAAKGEIILFLGDDVRAHLQLIDAHLQAHKKWSSDEFQRAVLGCIESEIKNNFMEYLTNYAQAQFQPAQWNEKDQILPFWQFYTANISVPKKAFFTKDKEAPAFLFDEGFKVAAYEDTELGYRLYRLGLKIRYNPEAVVTHDHEINLEEFCHRQEIAGKYAVLAISKHPELINILSFDKLHKNKLRKYFLKSNLKDPLAQNFGFDISKSVSWFKTFFERILINESTIGIIKKLTKKIEGQKNTSRKPTLFFLYARLIYYYHRRGIEEALKEKNFKKNKTLF